MEWGNEKTPKKKETQDGLAKDRNAWTFFIRNHPTDKGMENRH